MDQPQAYLGGKWIPGSEAAVPVGDAGFVLGATVTEQLRTFGGKLFHLDDHLDRLGDSLRIVGIEPVETIDEIGHIARQLVARNHPLLAAGDDLGLAIFVTPGPYPAYPPPTQTGPLVCLHTYPLPFHLWAEKYTTGQALVTTQIEQVDPRCWPPELKCRSRMHYYLADRRAAEIDPSARALLLDGEGSVTEASTANILIYREAEGLVSPPEDKILHGISLAVAWELARSLGIPTVRRDLSPDDVAGADEVLLGSTPLCLLPVTRFGGRPIGDGKPGDMFHRLMAAWNALAGIDVVAQAERFAERQ